MSFAPFRPHPLLAAVSAILLAAPAAFGSSCAHAQASSAVAIKYFMFQPVSLAIKAGATVTWKNLDVVSHSVADKSGVIHSGNIGRNGTFAFRFDKRGVYKIICLQHPNMKQTITVQ